MKALILFIFVASVALGGACSSGRGDPLGVDDGSSLPGQNLANAAVDTATALEFYLQMIYQLHASFQKAQNSNASLSEQGRTVNFLGDYSGNGLGTSNITDTLTVQLPEILVKYEDFSNNGRLFFEGSIHYMSTWRKIEQVTLLDKWILNGKANFAGDYAGSIEFDDLHVGLDSTTGYPVDLIERIESPRFELPLTGTVLILSGSNRIFFTPNEVDWPRDW